MSNSNSSTDIQQRHQKRMQRQKQIVDEKVAQANIERGIVVLISGNGKGKSSSAFGMLARSLGHGHRCAVVQFIKGEWACGENKFFEAHPMVDFFQMKTGFTWDSQDFASDQKAAQDVWDEALTLLSNPEYSLIIFDEITYMFKFKYLVQEDCIKALQNRPREQSIVLTGRGASAELIEIADTYSEIQLKKHAFNQGIKARKGIEW